MQILLADDHSLVREGIRPFLETLGSNVEVIEASNLQEGLRLATKAKHLDLAILDLHMPGMDGLNGIKRMAAEFPDIPIVILSGFVSRKDVLVAIEYGASGYIPKTISGKAMISALRLVLSGEKYLPADIFSGPGADQGGASGHGGGRFSSDNLLATLSKREWEVLGLLIDGQTNKQIARKLGLQEITVKIHVRNTYKKLAATNRADAVRIALRSGWEDDL